MQICQTWATLISKGIKLWTHAVRAAGLVRAENSKPHIMTKKTNDFPWRNYIKRIYWCFAVLLGYEQINVGYSRRPTWNVQMVFQFGEFRVDSTQHTHTKKRICQISNDKRKSQPRFGLDWTRGGKSWRFNFASAVGSVWVVRIPCRKMRSKRWGLGERHGWTWRDVNACSRGGNLCMTIRYRLWGREHSISGPGAAAATRQDAFLLYQLALNAPRRSISRIRICWFSNLLYCCRRHLRSAGFPILFLHQLWHHRVPPLPP